MSEDLDARLNIPVTRAKLEEYKKKAKAAGYSTMAEWVRRVLDGREPVEKPDVGT